MSLRLFYRGSVAVLACALASLALAGPIVPRSFTLRQPAPAHAAPPSGPLNAVRGQEVGVLPSARPLVAQQVRTYGGFNGVHVWLQVASPQGPVWIYAGLSTDAQPLPSGIVPAP